MLPVALPRPLVQITLGAVIGLVADWRVTLDPEIFFLLFLPPLLFLDGWRIPREELFKDGKTILGLALGLVVFTVVGMGLFIHWLVPAMRSEENTSELQSLMRISYAVICLTKKHI